jgi:predicted negative regulator of RcsB-dependent stress response
LKRSENWADPKSSPCWPSWPAAENNPLRRFEGPSEAAAVATPPPADFLFWGDCDKNAAVHPFPRGYAMKREIKKKLKEDEFVHGFSWLVDWVEKWKKEVIIAVAVIVGLALLWTGVQVLNGIQNRKNSAVLGEILTLRADLAKNPQSLPKLEALAVKGKFARVAGAQLASYWIEQGALDKAEKALPGPSAGPRDFFYFQARDLAAQIAMLKGDYEGAIKILQAIEDLKPADYNLDAVLYHRAEAMEKKGDAAGALALYKKIQTDYAQSYYGYDAGQKVRKLEPAK